MSRKIVPLTGDRLATLPPEVAGCLFWEYAPVERERIDTEDRLVAKQAWLRRVESEWGGCGQVALLGDEVRGLMVYAPGSLLPGIAALPSAPASPDAVVMGAAWVAPDRRRHGVGRMLVQAMARDLVKRGDVRAVEAFGVQAGPATGCVLPAVFLGATGFRTQRSHPYLVRMRMDLATTRPWRDEVESALDLIAGVVRRPAPPVRPEARAAESAGQST
ncbi:MAG: GNAT family N-acetyltransferase [Nocardioides sp.]|jgi:GNAT superfamily N-acetyltransferase